MVEDTWLLATEDGEILMKTDQELKVGSTMTFMKSLTRKRGNSATGLELWT